MIREILTQPLFIPEGELNPDTHDWDNATVGVKIVCLLDNNRYISVPVVWSYSDMRKNSQNPSKQAQLIKSLFENALNVTNDLANEAI